MIHVVLGVLRDKLNEYLKNIGEMQSDAVAFIQANNDPVFFTEDKVTPFLMNVSEDKKFRNADQYAGVIQNGIRTQINPEIRIELMVLFVSKFKDYNQALKFLSHTIKFFQAHRVLTPLNTPQLSEEKIEKLTIELVSLPLEEQNQVWHSLSTSYLPSVLYRIRLLSFIDDVSTEFVGEGVSEISINLFEKENT